MSWLKKAEWAKPKEEKHNCPPRIEMQTYIIGNKKGEEIPAPGSIWKCDECGTEYELLHYEMGIAVWQERHWLNG